MRPLLRAWIWLIGLSAATTLVAVIGVPDTGAGVIILAIAWAKARLIFRWYLGLAHVPGWRQGVDLCLGVFCLLLLGLYLAALTTV